MKIFLFDFDGVIINTLPIAVETYNKLLADHKIPKKFTPDKFAELFLNNFHESFEKIVPDEAIRDAIIKKSGHEFVRREADFEVFEQIKETLSKLSQAGKIIIISSNRTHFIQELLKRRGITGISGILGDDAAKSKIIKINWQKEKYPAANIYYIGDTVGDIREGKQTKVITVAVSWGFHPRKLLEKENPDYLFDKPEELLKLI